MKNRHSTLEVFVPRRFPRLTYNERLETSLRNRIGAYLLKGAGECLIVHGASKTGKTVLVERWLPPENAIWVRGDEISSIDDLYRRIIDDLDLFTEVDKSKDRTMGGGIGVGAEAGLSKLLRFKFDIDLSAQRHRGVQESRRSLNVSVVKNALEEKPVPIVIDDFHFMDAELRLAVARAVKDLIRLTTVILIAIPHSAFEPLRQLRDMDWRIQSLEVTKWKASELTEIGRDGFKMLGIIDGQDKIANRLARESRGAPSIMQALCLEYVTEVLELWETSIPSRNVKEPDDWHTFFKDVASSRKPVAFDVLIAGKKTRGKARLQRVLHTGEVTDIYGVIFLVLSRLGVFERTSKNAIALEMSSIVKDAPKPETISSTLKHIAQIASEQSDQDDPAFSYQDPEFHILDPFLAFYLAYGAWKLPAHSTE